MSLVKVYHMTTANFKGAGQCKFYHLSRRRRTRIFVNTPYGHHNPHFTKRIQTCSKLMWGPSLSLSSIYGGSRGAYVCCDSGEHLDLSYHLFRLASPAHLLSVCRVPSEPVTFWTCLYLSRASRIYSALTGPY